MKARLLNLFLFFIVMDLSAQSHRFDPPWNTPPQSAVSFTVPGVDNLPDIYGDIQNPQLVVFMGGNQFMVLDDLLVAFRKQYPRYKKILVETLPPGLLMEQIKGGSLTIGNMRLTIQPDIYTAGADAIDKHNDLFEKTAAYSANKLALMVQKGNPLHIVGLADLQQEHIRISMPDKKYEGIGKTVEEAYMKAGGVELFQTIMVKKVKDSTTFLTQIHHRQSPMRILYNQSDVAPVWETEIQYQKSLGHAVDGIKIPEPYNKLSVSKAAVLKNAPHKQAAQDFLTFLTSAPAKAVFTKYGFSVSF
jgi:molybdate transport system substrate-binding protein